MIIKENIISILFILKFLLAPSSGITKLTRSTDTSAPDESDMNLIDQWLNSSKNSTPSNENPNRDDLNAPSSSTTTTLRPTTKAPSANISEVSQKKNEKGEPCKCVKFYLCNVKEDNVTSTTMVPSATEATSPSTPTSSETTVATNAGTESSQNIADVVDIRDDLKSKCPDFEICCAVKNIKEKVLTTSTPATPITSESAPTPVTTPPPYSGHKHCGHRNEQGIAGSKQVGEKEAKFGEFPWTAAIINLEKTEDNFTVHKYIGGGSLIHPKVILTVAHNVLRKSKSNLKVRLGEWDTQTNEESYPSQDRNVEKVIMHKLFLKKTLYNDVALLILDEEVNFAPNVDTICLPPLPKKGKKSISFDEQLCVSAGWGKDQFGAEGRYSEIMKKVTVPVMPHKQCEKELKKSEKLPNFVLDKSFMCAGGSESGEDTCKGKENFGI